MGWFTWTPFEYFCLTVNLRWLHVPSMEGRAKLPDLPKHKYVSSSSYHGSAGCVVNTHACYSGCLHPSCLEGALTGPNPKPARWSILTVWKLVLFLQVCVLTKTTDFFFSFLLGNAESMKSDCFTGRHWFHKNSTRKSLKHFISNLLFCFIIYNSKPEASLQLHRN